MIHVDISFILMLKSSNRDCLEVFLNPSRQSEATLRLQHCPAPTLCLRSELRKFGLNNENQMDAQEIIIVPMVISIPFITAEFLTTNPSKFGVLTLQTFSDYSFSK